MLFRWYVKVTRQWYWDSRGDCWALHEYREKPVLQMQAPEYAGGWVNVPTHQDVNEPGPEPTN